MAYGALEKRFVRAVAAAANDHAIEPFGKDAVLDMCDAIGQTGQVDEFRVGHIRPIFGLHSPVWVRSSTSLIVSPQVQTKTPTRGSSPLTSRSGGKIVLGQEGEFSCRMDGC